MPKISALPTYVNTDLTTADYLPFVDSTGPTTGKMTVDNFRKGLFLGSGMTSTPLAQTTTITLDTGLAIGSAGLSAGIGVRVRGTGVVSSGNASYGAYLAPTHDVNATTAGYALFLQPVTAAAAFTQVNSYGLYVANASIGAGSAITNQYGIYIEAPTGAATINRALHIVGGGAMIVAGNLGVGTTATPTANRAVYVSGVSTVAAANSSYGVFADLTFDSGATTLGIVYYAKLQTAAAAFTMSAGYGLYIDTPVKGAGSAITTAYGILVKAQTQGGVQNYGINIEAPSGGSNNIDASIYVAAGVYGVRVNGASSGTTTTKYGVASSVAFDSNTSVGGVSIYSNGVAGATMTSLYGLLSACTTSAAAFTLTNRYGVYIDNIAKGAGSTITNDYGLYIVNPTDGGTLNRAVFISGAAAIVDNQGKYLALSGTAVPATAGAVAAGAPLTANSNGMTIEWTTDAPTHTRPKGSICLNLGGSSTSTRAYINTDGAGTWTAITTAA